MLCGVWSVLGYRPLVLLLLVFSTAPCRAHTAARGAAVAGPRPLPYGSRGPPSPASLRLLAPLAPPNGVGGFGTEVSPFGRLVFRLPPYGSFGGLSLRSSAGFGLRLWWRSCALLLWWHRFRLGPKSLCFFGSSPPAYPPKARTQHRIRVATTTAIGSRYRVSPPLQRRTWASCVAHMRRFRSGGTLSLPPNASVGAPRALRAGSASATLLPCCRYRRLRPTLPVRPRSCRHSVAPAFPALRLPLCPPLLVLGLHRLDVPRWGT